MTIPPVGTWSFGRLVDYVLNWRKCRFSKPVEIGIVLANFTCRMARPPGAEHVNIFTAAVWHALSAAKGVVCGGRARLILNFASHEGNLSVVASPVKKLHGMDLSDLLATKLGKKRFPAKRAARKV